MLPAVDRRGRELRPRRGHRDGGDHPPADAADRRPARARARCSTSPATRAGAGSRRPTARTRTSPPSWAAPTSRRSRAPTCADGVVATGKHMVGHGLAEGGTEPGAGPHRRRASSATSSCSRSRPRSGAPGSPASCPPTATSTACRATPRASCSPAILRGEWGFDGIVASDYIGVEMIATAHRLTADLGEAARLALVAGVDAELPRTVGLRRAARGGARRRAGWTSRCSTRPSRASSG